MGHPYREFSDHEVIRAEDWKEIQAVVKREIRTHRHGGGTHDETDPAKLGGLLTSESLVDGAVTMEKLQQNSVSSRALAPQSIGPQHFQDNAGILESKVAFDPDEPVSYATVDVNLAIPEALLADGPLLWAIPTGTPITNDAGDIVFRTIAAHTLSHEAPSLDVTVRAEGPGSRYNLPAGFLTRVGGALDPFLREHISVTQLGTSQGGADGGDEQPPQASDAQVTVRFSERTPRTFWVVPKGSSVSFRPDPGAESIPYLTRESLTVFPCTTWVWAEAQLVGEHGNVAAGTLNVVDDATLGPEISVTQVEPATGGTVNDRARVRVCMRLLSSIPESDLVIPAHLPITGGSVAFRTEGETVLSAAGTGYVIADPVDPDTTEAVPLEPLDIASTCRPRTEKTHDPSLLRHLTAVRDPDFAGDPDLPSAIRLAWTFSERAPHTAWSIPHGTRFIASGRGSSGDSAAQLPGFELQDDWALVPCSAMVVARAESAGFEPLPAGSLRQIVSDLGPSLTPVLELDQLTNSRREDSGIERTLLRFRVVEGAALPAGEHHWLIPAETIVSSGVIGEDGYRTFRTQEPATITLGSSGLLTVRAVEPGSHGNLPAGILDLIHPDSHARIGSAIDDTLIPHISVAQPTEAHGGGDSLERASAQLLVSIAAEAPRYAWSVPTDTRLVRSAQEPPEFETLGPLAVLPRCTWGWAASVTDGVDIGPDSLTEVLDPPATLEGLLWVGQGEASSADRVRVWLRVLDHAPLPTSRSWTIPAGTLIADSSGNFVFSLEEELVIDSGGSGIIKCESTIAGSEGNGVTDINGLANPEDFERSLMVVQELAAVGGADGGSEGHHHGVGPGALPSHQLAPGTVGAEQLVDGSVIWAKLEPDLSSRIQTLRNQLEAVEQTLSNAGVLAALAKQRHQ